MKMAFDGLFTRSMNKELQHLTSGRINKIYQPNALEVVLQIRAGGENFKLLFSIHPSYSRVHITEQAIENPADPPMFCMLLRKHIEGGFITSITQDGLERVITFEIDSKNEIGDSVKRKLIIEVMGRHSNLLLIDAENDKILDSLKHLPPSVNSYRTVLPGQTYIAPPKQEKVSLASLSDTELQQFFTQEVTAKQVIEKFAGFSPLHANELLYRMQTQDIVVASRQLMNEISTIANPTYLEVDGKGYFSPTNLTHLQGHVTNYATLGELLDRSLPKHMQSMMTARVKIMGGLNITENRIPQDGRIKVNIDFKSIDIRLSTLPTVFGEKIVMRILDITNAATDISKLGFTRKNEELFRKMIAHPNGIVLITGPTGSGKSSTLYAALSNLNNEGVNIITVEDPVEYQLSGVNQIQVKEEVGLTFAVGLRSILRQDPDIVMIGEIRDLETAQIAIRASLTGHLVLSTLHTNSAVESISRLQDMGIEPFLISSSIVGVMAQRLVRKVCRDCGTNIEPTAREREIFKTNGLTVETVRKGRGCVACGNTGYKGRLAIHELLPIDRQLKELILSRASSNEIRDYMQREGYYTLLQDGLLKVLDGVTTTEEVLRVATID